MTPEQQRIAIFRAMDWVDEVGSMAYDGGLLKWKVWRRNGVTKGDDVMGDPLNDLNAMHEAEKVLSTEQVREYAAYLVDLCETLKPARRPIQAQCTWHATASQRAEAFLRTLNLWTP